MWCSCNGCWQLPDVAPWKQPDFRPWQLFQTLIECSMCFSLETEWRLGIELYWLHPDSLLRTKRRCAHCGFSWKWRFRRYRVRPEDLE